MRLDPVAIKTTGIQECGSGCEVLGSTLGTAQTYQKIGARDIVPRLRYLT